MNDKEKVLNNICITGMFGCLLVVEGIAYKVIREHNKTKRKLRDTEIKLCLSEISNILYNAEIRGLKKELEKLNIEK